MSSSGKTKQIRSLFASRRHDIFIFSGHVCSRARPGGPAPIGHTEMLKLLRASASLPGPAVLALSLNTGTCFKFCTTVTGLSPQVPLSQPPPESKAEAALDLYACLRSCWSPSLRRWGPWKQKTLDLTLIAFDP